MKSACFCTNDWPSIWNRCIRLCHHIKNILLLRRFCQADFKSVCCWDLRRWFWSFWLTISIRLLPEFVKGSSIFESIIDNFRLFPASNHPSIAMLILVAPATNIISKLFPWLVLNRSRKICLDLQCIRVVGCMQSNFFRKVRLFPKTVNWNPTKNVFPEIFWH